MTLAGYNPNKGPEAFTLLASECDVWMSDSAPSVIRADLAPCRCKYSGHSVGLQFPGKGVWHAMMLSCLTARLLQPPLCGVTQTRGSWHVMQVNLAAATRIERRH